MKKILKNAVPARVPPAIIERGADLSGLPAHVVQTIILEIWRSKGQEHYDTHMLFQYAKNRGCYKRMAKKKREITQLRCLTLVDRTAAEATMQRTTPPGNIVHTLERLQAESIIQEHQFQIYMAQYLLGCSISSAMGCAANGSSIFQTLNVAKQSGIIDGRTQTIAMHAYCFLADPEEVLRVSREENTEPDNFEVLADHFELHGLANANIARMRLWQPVPRDEIQEIFDLGRGSTEQEAREEISIQRLIKGHGVDRADAVTALRKSDGVMEKAHEVCATIAKGIQEKLAKQTILLTRDTRSPLMSLREPGS